MLSFFYKTLKYPLVFRTYKFILSKKSMINHFWYSEYKCVVLSNFISISRSILIKIVKWVLLILWPWGSTFIHSLFSAYIAPLRDFKSFPNLTVFCYKVNNSIYLNTI